MRRMIVASLLVGAGFLTAIVSPEMATAQLKGRAGGGARPPVNRPAPRPASRPTPSPNLSRPAPRPSTPTPSRPPARPAPARPAPARPTPAPSRPSIGQRPNLPNPGGGALANKPSISRPTTPKPVTPSVRPGGGGPGAGGIAANRPTTLPGGLGGGSKPITKPSLPNVSRPGGGNSNNRPSVLPGKPDLPNNRPGTNLPNRPETKPSLPPIGNRPNLPNKPDRPNVNWPSKPDVLPNRPGNKPDAKLPNLPNKPPGISWPNRPGVGGGKGDRPNLPDLSRPDRPNIVNRPGINLDGRHNTVINNNNRNLNINNTTVNQVNRSNNYFGGNNFSRNSRVGNAIYDYHGAWHNNYSYWQRSYHPWYHGAWNGNAFSPSWGINTGVGLGISTWGLNSLAYSFGYYSYLNPFYVAPPPTVILPPAINYSQPVINVVQALPETGEEPPPMPETAKEAFDIALEEFKKGNYRTAVEKTEQALKDFPNDPAMHQFRALALFALGEYQQAASAIHAVLASGPGWDWTTLTSLYADMDTYTNQLAALEKAVAAKPDDPALWFLLAYQYTTAGNADSARDALSNCSKLLPNDSVVTQLAQAAGVNAAKIDPKEPLPEPPADVQLDIAGNWSAPRPDGGSIGLTMNADGAFTWTVNDKTAKKDAFDGTFTLEDNVLILERKTGGALMGRVIALADNKFQFKVVGSGDADPGLTFTK